MSECLQFRSADDLAAQYGQPVEFVRRLLSSCEAAGVGPEHGILRYLIGDKSEPAHPGVQSAHREAMREERDLREPRRAGQ